ncbi:MAG: manganese efflux pump MntP family protein, partial [Candidatus Aminicenantales bacterium]
MSIFIVLGIAIALAMDAFGVSLGMSAALKNITQRQVLRVAFAFGLFQFMMPILGWLAGTSIQRYIETFDHWVGFGLLLIIGGRMAYHSLKVKEEKEERISDPTRGALLLLLALATSIDALAVGLSLAVIDGGIIYPAVVIGLVAFTVTVFGMKMGSAFGSLVKRGGELVGGLILILIGVIILLEH